MLLLKYLTEYVTTEPIVSFACSITLSQNSDHLDVPAAAFLPLLPATIRALTTPTSASLKTCRC